MTTTFTMKGVMVIEDCIKCGVPFAVTQEYQNRRKKDHGTFYCPNGHSMYYPGKTEEERLREQLQRRDEDLKYMRQSRDLHREQAEENKRRAASYKGHFNRVKKRISAGDCPMCDQHFEDLEEHMSASHPHYHQEE